MTAPRFAMIVDGELHEERGVIAIADIKIGDRHRKNMGDIPALARSISERGLLHPIVLRPNLELIAGERRIRAFQFLGRKEIPYTIVDINSIVAGEAAENFDRLEFTPSEAVAIKRALEPAMKEAARERQGTRSDLLSGKLPESQKGDTRDQVATLTGYSARTLDKAAAVVEAARRDPEKNQKFLDEMDRTGRVDAPFRRLTVATKAENIRRAPPPLPKRGPYRVFVADPPWAFEAESENAERATYLYPPMSIAQICALPVRALAADDAICLLWITNFHLPYGFEVLRAWGFEYRTVLTWGKTNHFGRGYWLHGQTEHCLFGIRGKPIVTLTNETTLLLAPRSSVHSEKPDEFYQLVERLCPAERYAEFFARKARLNWDGFGDDAGGGE